MTNKILVIDDDPAFLRLVDQVFAGQGLTVCIATDSREGLKLFCSEKPEVALLDVSIAGVDGQQVCQRIRDISDTPIIILTDKRRSEEDIVHGLEYGVDEYLFKPVEDRELVARVRAALRAAETHSARDGRSELNYTDDFLSVDLGERKILVNGESVKLTPREFRLFTLLVEQTGRIYTHREMLEKVWGWEYANDPDYVRIYISHLRQKIEPDSGLPRYIISEPGVGYYFQKGA